jgi:inner membrane protein YidH
VTEPDRPGEPSPPSRDLQRTSMAAERTWLAWWRTALAASVGALGVGRIAPQALDVPAWPYIVLGVGYAVIAVGLLLVGARRQHDLQRALDSDSPAPLSLGLVRLFTVGGVVLALVTVVLIVAQT